MGQQDTRLTRGDIHSKVAGIAAKYKVDILVNFQSPGGRSMGRITDSQYNNISPRLNITELANWLDGFEEALKVTEKDNTALIKAALLLAELAKGLHANQKAGPIHQDFLNAANIVEDYR